PRAECISGAASWNSTDACGRFGGFCLRDESFRRHVMNADRNRTTALVVFFIGLAILLGSGAATTAQEPTPKEVEALKKQVERLQKEIAALQAQNKKLKA